MTRWTSPDEGSLDTLISAVAERAATDGGTWFPELDTGRLRVHVHGALTRSRCFLYRMEVSDGRLARPLVVKVRHSDPNLRRPDRFEQRPILAPVRTMPDRDTAHREYEGLVLIRNALAGEGGSARRFGVLRPLAWLPEHAAIVTDLVDQPTLRTTLLGTSRLRLRHVPPMSEQPWHDAGAWLRLFHDHETELVLPPRTQAASEVGELFRQFAEFLRDRIGSRPLLDRLSKEGHEIAEAALPPVLPLGTGHGDFVANNMFLSGDGRITVFDPLPVWRLPIYQDLATMAAGLRALSSQALAPRLAPSPEDLDRYESALYRGYFGQAPVPRRALSAFGLLVMLDRWSSLVSRRSRRGGVRPYLREAWVRAVSRHYQDEACRLSGQLPA